MKKRKFILFLMLIGVFFSNVQPIFAQGSTTINTPEASILSVPSSVDLNQTFTIKMKYYNDTEEGYTLYDCPTYSQFQDDRAQTQSGPLFTFVSGTLGTTTLSQIESRSRYFIADPAQEVKIEPGETINLTYTVKAGSSELSEGEKVYLSFGCSQKADSGFIMGSEWLPRTVKINETPEPEPNPVTNTTITTTTDSKKKKSPPVSPIALELIEKLWSEELFKENSTTSDLRGLSVDDSKEVEDFTLDVVGKSKIEFLEKVDLSGEEIADKFVKFEEYISLKSGAVSIDSEAIPQLNKNAKITFYNLNLLKDEIEIYKDGKDVTDEVKNLEYKNKNLSFEVDSFSEYKVGTGLTILQPIENITVEEGSYLIKGKVSDLDSKVVVEVNGKKYDVKDVDDQGRFEKEVTLKDGENKVSVLATSVSGKVDKKDLVITWEEQSMFSGWIYLVMGVFSLFLLTGGVVYMVIRNKRKSKNSDTEGKKKEEQKEGKSN